MKDVTKHIHIKNLIIAYVSNCKRFIFLFLYLINSLGKSEFIGKDFQVKCTNPTIFLIIMSLFRKAYSLKIKIFSLIIISKDFYKLLDFWDPKVKYLLIDWYSSPFYPVNSFENDGWIFDSSLEDNKEIDELSLSAYAVFKFLVNSNFIYTLKEIKVIWTSAKDNFEIDFNFLLEEFRKLSPEPVNLKVNVCHNLPNLYIYNFKEDLKYYEYSIRNVLLYGQIYEKVIFSKANDEKNESKADEFIFQLLSEEKEYNNISLGRL